MSAPQPAPDGAMGRTSPDPRLSASPRRQSPTPGPFRPRMRAVWLGRASYDGAHALQIALRDGIVAEAASPTLLLLEHDPVITFGRRGEMGDLLAEPEALAARGIAVRFTERGGRATFHGPGQLVGYPVAPLRTLALDLPTYLWRLEETLIRAAASLGIAATRCPDLRGVWVGDAKLASLGIAVSRGVCWHGFALNVNPDLSAFDLIRPCGLQAQPTSLSRCSGRSPPVAAVAQLVAGEFGRVFGVEVD